MRLRLATVPTAVWVWAFAIYAYVATVVCAAWFLRQGVGTAQPVGLWRSLAWQAMVYGFWAPAGLAVWLILRRFGAGVGGVTALCGAAAVFTVFEALATTGVGSAFEGRALTIADWSGRALAHAPVALLLFTAMGLVGVAAVHHGRGRTERQRAEHLEQALREARQALAADRASEPDPAPRERLWVMVGSRRISLDPGEVDWFSAAGNYVVVHWQDREGLVRETLTAMEARLDPTVFARSHRSALVNLARVAEARSLSDGSWRLTMAGGAELVASRTYRDDILKRLGR